MRGFRTAPVAAAALFAASCSLATAPDEAVPGGEAGHAGVAGEASSVHDCSHGHCIEIPPTEFDDFHFDGIETGTYGDGDELRGTWPAAVGAPPIRYTLVVEALDGTETTAEAIDDTKATVGGLADGEYRMRVVAEDALGRRSDGGVVIEQLVGRSRTIERSNVPLTGAADVHGDGSIVAVAGGDSNLSFMLVDVSEAENPVVLARVRNQGFVQDVKVEGDLLFTSGERGEYGAYIWDISDPENPRRLSRIRSPTISGHNVTYGNGHLFVADNRSGGMAVYDVNDPARPQHIQTWLPRIGFVHDQTFANDRLYVAFWAGFVIMDATDPAAMQVLAVHYYGGRAACHNVAPLRGGRFLMTTDEVDGGHVRIWDVRDTSAIEQIAEWEVAPGRTVHNVYVRGDHAYLSYYRDGMRILDVSRPRRPHQVGWFGPHARDVGERAAEWDGTWGLWLFGDHIAIGNTDDGLTIVDYVPTTVTREP